MTTSISTPGLTIGELEANYPLYCKAMRLLIREGKTIAKVRRTVCWQRLEILHNCLPTQYREPDYLFALLQRELSAVHYASLVFSSWGSRTHRAKPPPRPLASSQSLSAAPERAIRAKNGRRRGSSWRLIA